MKKTPAHTIDFIFPIAVFFAFSSTALVALLLAANIYQNLTKDSQTSFWQGTTLSYLSEKIRQNDDGGTENICIDTLDGHEALAISQVYGDTTYITYIYEADGMLKELFIEAGIHASAQSGTTIMEVESLNMYEIKPGLFHFTCTSNDGSTDSAIISVHSQ